MIFPAVLIFWAARRIRKRQNAPQDEQKKTEKQRARN
jgi:hypothetical protein